MVGHGTNPLGQHSLYADRYSPELLYPVARSQARFELGLDAHPAFFGTDRWNAYELSWLNARGKPVAMRAELLVPCSSPNLIESKSLKLYLNGFANTVFAGGAQEVEQVLLQDLSACAGASVEVRLGSLESEERVFASLADAVCLDELDVPVEQFDHDPALLEDTGGGREKAQVYTHLFRSLCPVTGQPDWASVILQWKGPAIPRAGLLRYLVSFRNHSGFHEQVVERIFMDLQGRYQPQYLGVQGCFTRRGGVDINPFRSTEDEQPARQCLVRQ